MLDLLGSGEGVSRKASRADTRKRTGVAVLPLPDLQARGEPARRRQG